MTDDSEDTVIDFLGAAVGIALTAFAPIAVLFAGLFMAISGCD